MSETAHQKITKIRSELRDEFIERDEQVDGALCALLSRQHMLMIGAPGTAKSMMTDRICSKIEGAQYFTWLLTKFSTPEEIFGPVSLKGLENDEYKRITTHKLPEAHIGFLDEVFKANSAILNALLTLINERKYHNNGAPVKVPLQSLFGASNELPEGEELGALYDRFMFRYIVNYIAEDSDMKKMLKGTSSNGNTIITLAELEQAQKEAAVIPVPDEILDTLIKIRNELKKEGVIASDRRFRFSIDILRAFAWLNGRKTVGEDDVVMLQHVLWSQPAELKTVQRVVLSTANPLLNKLTELFDQAQEIFKNCMDAVQKDANQASGAGVEANAKLKVIATKFVELENTAKQQGRDTRNIQEHAAKVSKMNAEVLEKCLGLKFT